MKNTAGAPEDSATAEISDIAAQQPLAQQMAKNRTSKPTLMGVCSSSSGCSSFKL